MTTPRFPYTAWMVHGSGVLELQLVARGEHPHFHMSSLGIAYYRRSLLATKEQAIAAARARLEDQEVENARRLANTEKLRNAILALEGR